MSGVLALSARTTHPMRLATSACGVRHIDRCMQSMEPLRKGRISSKHCQRRDLPGGRTTRQKPTPPEPLFGRRIGFEGFGSELLSAGRSSPSPPTTQCSLRRPFRAVERLVSHTFALCNSRSYQFLPSIPFLRLLCHSLRRLSR